MSKTKKTKVKAKTKAKTKAKAKKIKKAKPTKVRVKSIKAGVKPTKARVKPTKAKPTKARRKKPTKPLKPVFERRPRKAPIEVVEPQPGTASQDEAYGTIQAFLESARSSIPEGWPATVRVHPYSDGSVDGQLQVKIPDDQGTEDVAWELMDAISGVAIGQRYWISVGGNYIIEADDVIYRRFRGMNLVQTNYQRAVAANIAEVGLVFRKTVVPGMAKRHKQGAHSIFIRLHWNPKDEHPKR